MANMKIPPECPQSSHHDGAELKMLNFEGMHASTMDLASEYLAIARFDLVKAILLQGEAEFTTALKP